MGPKRVRHGVSTATSHSIGRDESSSRQPTIAQTPLARPRRAADDFDQHQFVITEAHRWFGTSFTSRNMVLEQVIRFSTPKYEYFKAKLERRQWLTLQAIPSPPRVHLVEEFYANLHHINRNRVYLRGLRWTSAPQPSTDFIEPLRLRMTLLLGC